MEKLENQTPTFESVWAALQETDRLLKENAMKSEMEREKSRKDFDQRMAESRADFDQRMRESDRRREESRASFDREMAESRANFDREMAESRANFDRKMAESRKDFDERMKKLETLTGSTAKNHGSFAEQYFFNSFEKGKLNFFGEKFDKIKKNESHHWQDIEDEYDIVLYNHTSVALVEVKFKAHENDIPTVIRKSTTFRILFPNYKNFKIYLGLASMSFYRELEDQCIEQGIAIIKQVGDVVVINDTHLKVY